MEKLGGVGFTVSLPIGELAFIAGSVGDDDQGNVPDAYRRPSE